MNVNVIINARKNTLSFNKLDKSYGIHHLIDGIAAGVTFEIEQMAQKIKDNKRRADLERILDNANQLLKAIESLWHKGEISPEREVICSSYDLLDCSENKKVNIGFYPIAANPIHWGHLLIGLSAMVKFKLDKVVFVVAGFDMRKQKMISAQIRHLIAQEVLDIFTPLFSYSSIALDSALDGEANMFKFLNLNNHAQMESVYLVGADHYYRINPKGEADTIYKIEEFMRRKLFRFNANKHHISLAFIERGIRPAFVETDLPINFLEEVPVDISSTMIRSVFESDGSGDKLVGLPYTAYNCIKELKLYANAKQMKY